MIRQPRRNDTSEEFSLELPRLKRIAILVPLAFLALIELIRIIVFPDFFRSFTGYLVIAALILIGASLFSTSIFGLVGRMQDRLTNQNQELLALHDAGLAVTSALDLQLVLQNVVNEARELVGARYGALALLNEQTEMEAFLTSGISVEVRASLGPIPQGHGLLGAVLDDPRPLRLPDLTRDPRSVGFPPGHPEMHSLLAVPILSHGKVLGSLYLTEKQGQPEFDASDQQRLERFATQAALAIENAHLHQQVRALAITEERDRIAREMHDSIAQVLGYVNTKGQAAQELLRAGQPERAEAQIAQLSKAAREAYADVRENILGLRVSHDEATSFTESLSSYLATWQDQSGISARLNLGGEETLQLGLSPLGELQLLRIIQEALSNVRKHSEASEVNVSLQRHQEKIEAQISDNGRGFDPLAIGHPGFPRFGMSTMRERAESVGGSIEIESDAVRGTTVTVTIPVQSPLQSRDEVERARSHR